ncbi:MAG TPA: Tad domain-containing protein [Candidatus Limnocylindrales bacterium]|nr:Tad domain-containing protein [Candidatus Limnocylindrales bacterium]
MHSRRPRTSGQTLVVFAIGLVAIVGMVGLIIDGGNAYAQQRNSQNGADSVAKAGATLLVRSVMGAAATGTSPTVGQLDAAVLAAANAAGSAHGLQPFNPGVAGNSSAYYTDILGTLLTPGGATTASVATAAQVGSGAVPTCTTNCVGGRAAGVAAFGERPFGTLIARIAGFNTFTASARATAVGGYAPGTDCVTTGACVILPITFATNMGTCTGTNSSSFGTVPWPWPIQPNVVGPAYNGVNESILAVCGNAQGAFGFLDFGCAPNIQQQIANPCSGPITFPIWLQTQPGNTNAVENELNRYAGTIVGTYESGLDKVVFIPFFDAICSSRNTPAVNAPIDTTTYPGVCVGSNPGGGNNIYYHIKYFLSFALDHAYVQGNNNPPCNAAPGTPIPGGNGGTGCLKGWGVEVSYGPGTVSANPGPGGAGSPLRIQLIK